MKKHLSLLVLLVLVQSLLAEERLFPPDAGMINVKSAPYNARGDGVTDDTGAIQLAISNALDRLDRYFAMPFVYLPNGTYLVNDTLTGRIGTNGWDLGWRTGLLLLGQSQEETIVKLMDNAPGFANPAVPKAVLYTASEKATDYNTYPGTGYPAKYQTNGFGNEAFRNSIINMTVDTGSGNPGAVGIDYLASNRGTVEDVLIRSGDGLGYCGLLLNREWPGPALIKRVRIEGFNYGVEMSHYQYGMTFEHLTLIGQRQLGIYTWENVAHIRHLVSSNAVPVLSARSGSHVVLLDAILMGGASTNYAITNRGKLYLRNITSAGYGTVISPGTGAGREIPGGEAPVYLAEYVSHTPSYLFPSPPSALQLPVEETPEFHTNDFSQWTSVVSYGATPDNSADDDGPAIQGAIDSGQSIVYLPRGQYHVNRPLYLRGAVRKLIGLHAYIGKGSRFTGDSILVFTGGTADTCVVEHLRLGGKVEHGCSQTLAFRHADLEKGYGNNANGSGKIFLEDVMVKPVLVNYPQLLWARQLNSEGNSSPCLVENHGGQVWIFGMKTEGEATAIKTVGGSTELLGTLFYPLAAMTTNTPLFINEDAQVSLSYLVSGDRSSLFPLHVRETRRGVTRQLLSYNVPSRGYGANMALYVGYTNSSGIYFEFSSLAPTQQANVAFPVAIRARTAENLIASNYTGVVSLAGLSTSSPGVPILPLTISNFVDGVWTGPVTVLSTNGPMLLQASDADANCGYSSLFTVVPPNDVQVRITDSPDPVVLGEELTFHIVITNTGPNEATGLTLSNTLPTSASFVSAVPSQGSCINASNLVWCEFGTLGAAQPLSIVITVVPTATGLFTTRATAGQNESDPFPANNTASTMTTVRKSVLSIADASVMEGDADTNLMTFTVSLWPPSTSTVSVAYATANGTASSTDYAARNGVLFFRPGETNQEVSIAVLGDLLYEANETFYVNLSAPTNASLGDGQAIGTIINDDVPPTVAVSDGGVMEGNSGTNNMIFTVWLSKKTGAPVVVNYATTNGTARSGSDYWARSGFLNFAAESMLQTQTVAVQVIGDTLPEKDETFCFYFTSVSNAVVGKNLGRGVITNEDGLGQLDHFAWNAISSPQPAAAAFSVTVTARDVRENLVSNFNGTVKLAGVLEQVVNSGRLLGEATPTSSFSNGLYTMGFEFTPTNGICVTHLRHYSGTKVSLWAQDGTLLVSQASLATAGRWTEMPLDTPVHLQADSTYRIGFYGGGEEAYYACSPAPTDFAHGRIGGSFYAMGERFPNLARAGGELYLADLVYTPEEPLGRIPITPVTSGHFANGTWAGTVSVLQAATNLVLQAEDAAHHVGRSEVLVIQDSSGTDTDGDGMPDAWEVVHGLDPNHVADAAMDSDNDGLSNLQEFLAGTDPRDAASLLRITELRISGSEVRLRFRGVPGQRYRLERQASLDRNDWVTSQEFQIGAQSEVELTDTGMDATARFYRISTR